MDVFESFLKIHQLKAFNLFTHGNYLSTAVITAEPQIIRITILDYFKNVI